MRCRLLLALVLAAASPYHAANAAAVAGNRTFPVTLVVDDPGVADEASLPTFSYQRKNGEVGPTDEYGFDFDFTKRVTENFGVGVNWGWNVNQKVGGKSAIGWRNLELSAKYIAYLNPDHEFLLSVGLIREMGGTGTVSQGAERFGSTQPVLFFGKGLGDMPIGALRPLAVTGLLGFQFTDVKRNAAGTNQGGEDAFNAGLTIQYSLPYLKAQVRDYGLPDFFNQLVPLVEMTWSRPVGTPEAAPTLFTIAPGIIYVTEAWQFGIEALIPGNAATGSHVGVIAQFHVSFDDLLPDSLGKPIFN